jgi:RNA polymerase sigma-70 factor (ECF subfamily)
VQDTLLRAWRRWDTYQGRASLRAWLYKISTNACLDMLEHRSRRTLPFALGPERDLGEPLAPPIDEPIWLDPYPTEQLAEMDTSPEARFALHESITLAFLVALQTLPPRQRAVLILRDVLDWPVADIAGLLETSLSAVNSALHRARTTLDQTYHQAGPDAFQESVSVVDEVTRRALERYVQAWETADIAGLTALLREDAILSMPPSPSWYRGRSAVVGQVGSMAFSGDAGDAVGRWRLLPSSANGQPAFAFYQRDERRSTYQGFGLQVLTFQDGLVVSIVAFLDPSALGRFGLPHEFGG